jgi:D-alanyl-D-alanine carboxypeptidase (penicillin-binding protein 5/6)
MKKLKKLISFLLAAAMMVMLASFCGTALAVEDPEIAAKAAILVERDSGEVLYSLNSDEEMEPASTTKIMTMLLAIEAIERGEVTQDDIVTVSESAVSNVGDNAVTAELEAGEEISLLNLLYLAALPSANDACNVIAEYISGSVENFVRLMNSRAAEMGCEHTHFMNANGMPVEGHYSSARDLASMIKDGYELELFRKITGTATYTVPSTNIHPQRSLSNTNKLLSKDSEYYYQHAVCGKTGSTTNAGYCLASVGSDSKLTLISVILGAEYDRNESGVLVYEHFAETSRLMEWGFNNFSYRAILDVSNLLANVPVEMGEGTDSVVLRPEKSITMLVENDISIDNQVSYDITVYSEVNDEKLVAPVYAGDVLGEVEVFYKGESQGTVKLVSNSTVPLMRTEYLKSEFKKGLTSKYIKGTIWFIVLLFIAYIVYLVAFYINKNKKRRYAEAAAYARENSGGDSNQKESAAPARRTR